MLNRYELLVTSAIYSCSLCFTRCSQKSVFHIMVFKTKATRVFWRTNPSWSGESQSVTWSIIIDSFMAINWTSKVSIFIKISKIRSQKPNRPIYNVNRKLFTWSTGYSHGRNYQIELRCRWEGKGLCHHSSIVLYVEVLGLESDSTRVNSEFLPTQLPHKTGVTRLPTRRSKSESKPE